MQRTGAVPTGGLFNTMHGAIACRSSELTPNDRPIALQWTGLMPGNTEKQIGTINASIELQFRMTFSHPCRMASPEQAHTK
jgi:hypothetical protein